MIKKGKKNRLKVLFNSSAGFSLIELVIVLSLLGLVLAGIYQFFFFGERGSARAQAEGEALQDARQALLTMEREIRQAQKPSRLSGLPEDYTLSETLKSAKAVTIDDSGRQMTIYSYVNEKPKRITYLVVKADGTNFYQMKRSVDDVGSDPTNWQIVVPHIVNINNGKYSFVADGKIVAIEFSVPVKKASPQNSIMVKAAYAVRGKDVMK